MARPSGINGSIPVAAEFCMKLIGLCSLVIVYFGTTAFASADKTLDVPVYLMESRDEKALDRKTVDTVLGDASQLINVVCGRSVQFKVVRDEDAAVFVGERQRAIAPYEVPSSWAASTLALDREAARRRIEFALRERVPLEEARAMFGLKGAESWVDVADIAAVEQMKWIHRVRDLEALSGKPLVNAENWQRFSMVHWGTYLHAGDWNETVRLYLTNQLLVDSSWLATQPEAIRARPVVNSVALPASCCSLVSYSAIISDRLNGGNN